MVAQHAGLRAVAISPISGRTNVDTANRAWALALLESMRWAEITFTVKDGRVELARKLETVKPADGGANA